MEINNNEINIEDQFIETDPIQKQAFFWVSIYYYLAKVSIDRYGKKGEAVIRQAIRDYGEKRGIRRRQKTDALGLEPNLVSLFTNGDLPGDDRFVSDEEKNILTPEMRRHYVLRCPDSEMWSALGGREIGQIYCEEIHHTLYGKYDDSVQVNLCETLTQGADCCRFFINMRSANDKGTKYPSLEHKSWDDAGSDGLMCNANAFGLFYSELSLGIKENLDEETLRLGIRAFAKQRGLRIRELNRRAEREDTIDNLLNEGDLFLDKRFQKEILSKDENHLNIKVSRCVFSEILKENNLSDLGQIYCEEIYRGICEAYNKDIEVDLKSTLFNIDHCEMCFYIKKEEAII